jgi:hypothetical protein
MNHRELLAIQLLQASADFLRGEFTSPFPFVQIPVSDDVVHREDPLGYALAVHNGQPAYLFVRHLVQSFMDFIIGLAGEDVSCGNL